MSPHLRKILTQGFIVQSLVLTLGCVSPAIAKSKDSRISSKKDSEASMTGTPHVANSWQKKFVSLMESEKWDDGWALFSEGGWSDAGQIFILANKDRTRLTSRIVAANNRETATDKQFTKTQLERFLPLFDRALSLSDVDEPMFDGLIFEYVHILREKNGTLKEGKRVYIRATGRIPHKDHEELIKAFQDIKGEG